MESQPNPAHELLGVDQRDLAKVQVSKSRDAGLNADLVTGRRCRVKTSDRRVELVSDRR